MTRLILIRHAKSGWDDPFADDHERVLTDRGRLASAEIGEWLAAQNYVPDVVLCSDAARAIETANGVVAAFNPAPNLIFKPTLYHASPDTILDLITRQTANCIAVVAHNPGIGMLANGLVRDRPTHHRFNDYPTCATTVIDFDSKISIRTGIYVDFIVPRDLTQ